MWVTDLGTRQSARCRVVASSSNREAMSFPWGTETRVKAIFSAAWCFLLENTISVSFWNTDTHNHAHTEEAEISVRSLKALIVQAVIYRYTERGFHTVAVIFNIQYKYYLSLLYVLSIFKSVEESCMQSLVTQAYLHYCKSLNFNCSPAKVLMKKKRYFIGHIYSVL